MCLFRFLRRRCRFRRPPVRESLPAAPDRLSLPPSPERVSLPPPPWSRLTPPEPVRLSLPGEPVTFSIRVMRSLPSPVEVPAVRLTRHGGRLAEVGGVDARAAVDSVVAWAAADGVVAGCAEDVVVAALSPEAVVAAAAVEDVRSAVAVELVVVRRPDEVFDVFQGVGALAGCGAGGEVRGDAGGGVGETGRVDARAADDQVIAALPLDVVVTFEAAEDVWARGADECVVPGRAGDVAHRLSGAETPKCGVDAVHGASIAIL